MFILLWDLMISPHVLLAPSEVSAVGLEHSLQNGKLLATSECVGGSRSQAAKPQAASGGSKRGRHRRTGTGSAAGGPQRAVQEQLEDGKSDVSMSPNAASVAGGSQPGRTSD